MQLQKQIPSEQIENGYDPNELHLRHPLAVCEQ
jgi:hypothetical protein